MTERHEPSSLDSGAYAADALSAEEAAAFEAALQRNADLAAEVRGLQATAARLGESAAEAPPTALRAKVLAEIDQTRQDLPPSPTESVNSSDSDGQVLDLDGHRARRRTTWVLGAAAAVLGVLVLGLSFALVDLRQDNLTLTQAGAEVTRVLTAPDAVTLSSAVEGQPGRGALVVAGSLGSAVFVADDLASVQAEQTYQLWYVGADGSARSAGIFVPGADGDAAVTLLGSPGTAAAVGMTLEPAGGSSQPTSPPILAIPLA